MENYNSFLDKADDSYFLFLDDMRHPYDCIEYMPLPGIYAKLNWTIVRNYDDFVDVVLKMGLPSLISFDHDLADGHYCPEEHWNNYDQWSLENPSDEKTGMDVAKWLVDYCIDNNAKLPAYRVHSMNPSGSKNIQSLLDNYKKFENAK
jgi:hypothetical protein